MSDTAWSGNESLSLAMAEQVDAVCSRFEKIWQAASGDKSPPHIEDFLTGTAKRCQLPRRQPWSCCQRVW
jgi:hypothetical protein